jgi:hypothetical protein
MEFQANFMRGLFFERVREGIREVLDELDGLMKSVLKLAVRYP